MRRTDKADPSGENRDDRSAERLLEKMAEDSRVLQMKKYVQHGKVSTYDHCRKVADLSCGLNRHMHLHADPGTLVQGAMLHDYYLYDWHHKDGGTHDWHGFIHAEKASANAKRDFDVDEKVQDVIRSHMWPLNLSRLPRSREAWIVCIADKCVSLQETIFRR